MSAAGIGEWPVVGRSEELAHIRSVVGSAEGRNVVIAGRAGVGKTRLARAALADLAEQGRATAWVTATRTGSTIPFGALAPLLPRPGRAHDPGILVDTLRLVRDEIADRAGPRGLLLAVDDAQWLDDASTVLVHQLAALPEVTALVTVRSGEPVADPITSLWKDGGAERIELQPLSPADLRRLLRDALGHEVDPDAAGALMRASAGNVLFLRELVRAALDQERLVLEQGRWCLRADTPPNTGRTASAPNPGLADLAPSTGLVELVESRVGDVAPETREVLEHLAVEEPLSLAILERVTSAAAIDRAVRRELVVIENDRRRAVVRLAHPLYGDALRSRMSLVRTRAIATALADRFEAQPRRRLDDAVRLAAWRLASGGLPAPATLIAGARQAQALGDSEAAERLVRAALDADADHDEVVPRLILAEAVARQGRFDEAMAVLDAASVDEDEPSWVRVAELRAVILFAGRDRAQEAPGILAAAELRASDGVRRWRLRAMRGHILNALGWPARAVAVVAESPDDPCPPEVADEVAGVRAAALAFQGRFAEAEHTVLDRAASADSRVLAQNGSVLFLVAFARGDLGPAHQLAEFSRTSVWARRDAEIGHVANVASGWVLLMAGDIDRATERFTEALPGGGAVDVFGMRATAVGGLLACHLAAGRIEDARALAPYVVGDDHSRWGAGSVVAAQAILAALHGDYTQARARLQSAWDDGEARAQHVMQLFVATAATSIYATDLSVPWLARLVERVEGPLVRVHAAQARAQHDLDGHALDRVSVDFEALGLLTLAARSSAAAAAIHDSRDERRPAAESRHRARGLMHRCPGLDLAHLDAPGPVPPLSDREREVARLAAGGLPSSVIAERLFISVRTVDSHLGKVYVKLGVGGRAELAGIAHVLDP